MSMTKIICNIHWTPAEPLVEEPLGMKHKKACMANKGNNIQQTMQAFGGPTE